VKNDNIIISILYNGQRPNETGYFYVYSVLLWFIQSYYGLFSLIIVYLVLLWFIQSYYDLFSLIMIYSVLLIYSNLPRLFCLLIVY
jgi:hypothetical protein